MSDRLDLISQAGSGHAAFRLRLEAPRNHVRHIHGNVIGDLLT